MRLAMTLGDIPLTSGQPSQGAEGIRFIGFALYDAMFGWDLSQRDQAAKLIPGLAESYSVDPETRTIWTFNLRKGSSSMTARTLTPMPSFGISTSS